MSTEVHPLLKRTRDIEQMVPYWQKVDAIVEGYESVKAHRTKFLPKFPDESESEYENRIENTKFTNIYRDVLEGLATKPFEQNVTLVAGEKQEIPEEMEDFADDVDGIGNNLSMFSALTFFNGINNAIEWIFIDHPIVDKNVIRSKKDQKEANIRPFWTHVLAKNVLEVRWKSVGAKMKISYFRMFEPSDGETPDAVRVFKLINNTVIWELHQKNEKAKTIDEQFVMVESGEISIGVIPFVPFATGRRDGNSMKFYPPMQDAADLQITLYRNESALEFIKTMACYPMLAANGMKPEKNADGTPKKLAVGPMRVLYGLPDGQGNHGEWKFVEPNANSMEFMQKNIDKTKQDLRELGRQPLTALSTQLTTVTTSIAAGKARSAVSAWAFALKDSLENALEITMMFMGVKNLDLQVNVYTGFDNVSGNSEDLEELGKARERGDISLETYLFELQRRKVLAPEFKISEEIVKLLSEIPSDETEESPIIQDSADEDDT